MLRGRGLHRDAFAFVEAPPCLTHDGFDYA